MRITISEAYVKYLISRGVTTIFCIPGGAIYPLLDALHDTNISLIRMEHEQSLVHAAEGYSFVTGCPAVVIVTSGPGVTNTLTGIANASFDHHSVVIIAGQVPTSLIGKQSFQEVDAVSAARKFSKLCSEASTPDNAIALLYKAFELAGTVPLGPSLVSVPSDLWTQKIDLLPSCQQDQSKDSEDTSQVTDAVNILSHSKKPLLLLGQGVNNQNIYADLQEFILKNSFPVASTIHGLGSFPIKTPNWLGMVGLYGSRQANFAAANCDALLILGASLNERVTGNTKEFAPHATVIHVDINPHKLGRLIESKLKICLSVETFISKIKDNKLILDNQTIEQRELWLHTLRQQPDAHNEPGYYTTSKKEFVPFKLFETINHFIKVEDVIVADCGQHQMWATQFLAVKRPKQFLTTGGFGTMGFGLPAAIGASLADSSKLIWCLTGDGGLMSSLQELAILKELQCNIKIIVFNNSGYGMVRQYQDMFYRQRRILSEIKRQWTFEDIGKSFKIFSKRVSDASKLREVLDICPQFEPALIEIEIEEDFNAYPIIQPGKSTGNLLPTV